MRALKGRRLAGQSCGVPTEIPLAGLPRARPPVLPQGSAGLAKAVWPGTGQLAEGGQAEVQSLVTQWLVAGR